MENSNFFKKNILGEKGNEPDVPTEGDLPSFSSKYLSTQEEPVKVTDASFPTYDKTVETTGKQKVSTWSKIGGFLKEKTTNVLDWVEQNRKEGEEADFKMRQIMYGKDKKIITDPTTGKKRFVSQAELDYEAAETPEEKAKIISEDVKEIPMIKFLNSDTGKKITKTISDGTSNIPLKVWAKVQTVGDEMYEAFNDPSFQNFADVVTAATPIDDTQSNKDTNKANLDALIAKAEDPNNPRWARILYGVQNSGVQSAIGTLLSVGTSYLARNPRAGTAVGTAYFSAISAEEERQKYTDGNIDSSSSIGNIAIDTIGDQMISGVAESALKGFAKEGAKATLKNTLAQGAKGFLVEGTTEPAQSLLKYANDYTSAHTEEKKQKVVESFANYIKTGQMLDEFLIGGITGGAVGVAASGAGSLVQPITNKSGVVLSPDKISGIKDDLEKDVEEALDNGDFSKVIDKLEQSHNLSEEDASKIIQDVAQDVVANNAVREAPQGSPEYNALLEDVTALLKQGITAGEVSIDLANLVGVSEEYAQNLMADAVTQLEKGQKSLDEKITETQKNTSSIQEKLGITTDYNSIAEELKSKGLDEDVVAKSGKALVTAISRQGTPSEKQAAIDLLSNPANTVSREIYSREIAQLPEDQEGSRAMIEKYLNKTFARDMAERAVQFSLEHAEAGYRVFREHNGASSEPRVYGVSSTFPQYVSEELRSRKLFDKVMPYVTEGIRPKETENNFRLARLYDEVTKAIDDFEQQYKAEENVIDLTQVQKDEFADIPFQAHHEQIREMALISNEEAQEIVAKYFDDTEVSTAFYEKLRTPRGTEAWGRYHKGIIDFTNNPREDTPHHEGVHAFLDLFVPYDEKHSFLASAKVEMIDRFGYEKVREGIKETRARYNNNITEDRAADIYAEEYLADGFYEYVQGRNQQTIFKKFYDMVIAFLKSMKKEFDGMRLYEEIIAKKRYNNEKAKENALKARRIAYAQEKGLDPNLFTGETVYTKNGATVRFDALKDKVKAFEGANSMNTHVVGVILSIDKVKVDSPLVVKTEANKDGMYSSAYAVTINQNGKERIVYQSENELAVKDWLDKNKNKEVEVYTTATNYVYEEGKTAHIITDNTAGIPMLKSLDKYTDVKVYTPTGEEVDTSAFQEKDSSLVNEAKKYDNAEDFIKSQSGLYHGTNADIKNGKLSFGEGGLKKGGQSGGLFLSDTKEVSQTFGSKLYSASPLLKSEVVDLTQEEGKKIFKKIVGKQYKTAEGELLTFTQDDYDYMFTNGKADFATVSQYDELIAQTVKSLGKKGIAFEEYAGGKVGKTYQILEGDVAIYTLSQLRDIWNSANRNTKAVVDKSLLNVHNLDSRKLLYADKIGGIVNPSLATINAKSNDFSNHYGDITLVGDKDLITKGLTYDADIYSPRHPRQYSYVDYELSKEIKADLQKEATAAGVEIDENYMYVESGYVSDLEYSLGQNVGMIFKFLKKNGVEMQYDPSYNDFSEDKKIKYSFATMKNNNPSLEQKYNEFVSDYVGSKGIKGYYFSHMTKSGRPSYVEETAENASKIMNKEAKTGVGGFLDGVGLLRSKLVTKLDEKKIQKNKDRLVSREEMEEVKANFSSEYSDLIEDVQALNPDLSFGDVGDNIIDYMTGEKKWLLQRVGTEIPAELDAKINDFVKRLKEAPTDYFETKVKEPIKVSDFKYALVPVEASDKVKEILKNSGVTVVEFSNETKRAQQMKELTDVMFQEIENTSGKDLSKRFPSYYALVGNKLVAVKGAKETEPRIVESFVPLVDEDKVIRSEKEQIVAGNIEGNQEGEKRVSAAYKRAKERLGEQFQEDVTYTPIKIADQMAKAFTLLETNPDLAKAIALGFEQPPLDITDTAISLAVAEQARADGDFDLQAQAERTRSLRQTRRGQELVMERGRVTEDTPDFFIKKVLNRRMELAQYNYKPMLGAKKAFMELLDEKIEEKKKKGGKRLKSDLEIKAESLDAFLAEIAC